MERLRHQVSLEVFMSRVIIPQREHDEGRKPWEDISEWSGEACEVVRNGGAAESGLRKCERRLCTSPMPIYSDLCPVTNDLQCTRLRIFL
jgi:hypothetical protein